MSTDGTNLEPPTPPPAEAFESLADHASHYNAEERAQPVTAVPELAPARPAEEPGADAPAADPETPVAAAPESDEPARDEAGKFAKKAKPRDNPQARVQQATREAAEARRRAAELEARVRELESRTTPAPAASPAAPEVADPSDPEPVLDQFMNEPDPYAAFAKAAGRWAARQEHQRMAAEYAQAQQAHAFHERVTKYRDGLDTVKTTYPDWDEKVADTDAHMAAAGFPTWPPVLLDALLHSDQSIELTRYLSTHPEDAVQLARDTQHLDAVAVPVVRRLLEARLSSGTPAVQATGPAATPAYRPAAPPIAPVRTGSPAATDSPPGDDRPFGEHKAYWDRQEREARRRH